MAVGLRKLPTAGSGAITARILSGHTEKGLQDQQDVRARS